MASHPGHPWLDESHELPFTKSVCDFATLHRRGQVQGGLARRLLSQVNSGGIGVLQHLDKGQLLKHWTHWTCMGSRILLSTSLAWIANVSGERLPPSLLNAHCEGVQLSPSRRWPVCGIEHSASSRGQASAHPAIKHPTDCAAPSDADEGCLQVEPARCVIHQTEDNSHVRYGGEGLQTW